MGSNGWVERIFNSSSARVEVYSEDRVLHPFSVLWLKFYVGGELLYETETIYKCDRLVDGCGFCWTQDNSMIILQRGRDQKTLPTTYVNILTWEGSPVFEDSYYEEVQISSEGMLMARKRGRRLFRVFRSLIVEDGNNLYRLVIDDLISAPIFSPVVSLSRELSL